MKTINRRSSHGHHGSKRRELAQQRGAHSRGSPAFTHTLTSTQLQPPCSDAPAQLLHNLEYHFYFEGT